MESVTMRSKDRWYCGTWADNEWYIDELEDIKKNYHILKELLKPPEEQMELLGKVKCLASCVKLVFKE